MAKIDTRIAKWAMKPMRPGEGLHVDIFRAAIILLEDGIDEGEVFTFLRRASDAVLDRRVPDREIHGAIQSAKDKMSGGTISTPKWPEYNAVLRAEIVANSQVNAKLLAEATEETSQDPWFYLERLYAPGDLVCVGSTSYAFDTKDRDEWKAFLSSYAYEYINPSPMTARTGLTKDGNVSTHCLANTGPKTYQVVEFDSGTVDEHAALLWHLATRAKLVLIVYSGGKSLHGWFNVRNWTEPACAAFFRSAVEVGADPKMWSRAQFSRLPAGWNTKTGKQQEVIVFEPKHA